MNAYRAVKADFISHETPTFRDRATAVASVIEDGEIAVQEQASDPMVRRAVSELIRMDDEGRKTDIEERGRPYDVLVSLDESLAALGKSQSTISSLLDPLKDYISSQGADLSKRFNARDLWAKVIVSSDEPDVPENCTLVSKTFIDADRIVADDASQVVLQNTIYGTRMSMSRERSMQSASESTKKKGLHVIWGFADTSDLNSFDESGADLTTLVQAIGPAAAAAASSGDIRKAMEEGTLPPAVEKMVQAIADLKAVIEAAKTPGAVENAQSKIAELKAETFRAAREIAGTDIIPPALAAAMTQVFDQIERPAAAPVANSFAAGSAVPTPDNDNQVAAPVVAEVKAETPSAEGQPADSAVKTGVDAKAPVESAVTLAADAKMDVSAVDATAPKAGAETSVDAKAPAESSAIIVADAKMEISATAAVQVDAGSAKNSVESVVAPEGQAKAPETSAAKAEIKTDAVPVPQAAKDAVAEVSKDATKASPTLTGEKAAEPSVVAAKPESSALSQPAKNIAADAAPVVEKADLSRAQAGVKEAVSIVSSVSETRIDPKTPISPSVETSSAQRVQPVAAAVDGPSRVQPVGSGQPSSETGSAAYSRVPTEAPRVVPAGGGVGGVTPPQPTGSGPQPAPSTAAPAPAIPTNTAPPIPTVVSGAIGGGVIPQNPAPLPTPQPTGFGPQPAPAPAPVIPTNTAPPIPTIIGGGVGGGGIPHNPAPLPTQPPSPPAPERVVIEYKVPPENIQSFQEEVRKVEAANPALRDNPEWTRVKNDLQSGREVSHESLEKFGGDRNVAKLLSETTTPEIKNYQAAPLPPRVTDSVDQYSSDAAKDYAEFMKDVDDAPTCHKGKGRCVSKGGCPDCGADFDAAVRDEKARGASIRQEASNSNTGWNRKLGM